jgi:hypothetical protein
MLAYVYDVHCHMMHPVRARRGDILVVRPGHPTRPIVVSRVVDGVRRPVRVGPPNYGALLVLEDDGVISENVGAVSLLPLARHPLVRQA